MTMCMKKFDVTWELMFGMHTLESLNRTKPDDVQRIGCVTRCKLQDAGHLHDDTTIAAAYEKKSRDDFERRNNYMRNDLDDKIKHIRKCANDLKADEKYDKCIYAYKMEKCVQRHGVYF